MTSSTSDLTQLLESHLAGSPVEVPETLALEFAQALAAHAALCDVLNGQDAMNTATDSDHVPPHLPSDYQIERELGHGGMGIVYLVRQQSLNRQVALKVLRSSPQAYRGLVDRFLQEAQHLAKLRHPHIVAIHEVGQTADGPYFTMDYVEGSSLTSCLARGRLSPSQAVELLKQIGAAVQHAHRQGIIHRDLKPGNILLDQQSRAFVTDFGLARQMADDSTLTQTGELLGTPQYMAPEQARGQTTLIGEATDIHALGLLLYEMLTGQPAFSAHSPADVLVKLLHDDPVPPRQLDHRIPRDLETICLKCLAKNPAARYANVAALLEDVRRYEAGEPLTARRPSRWTAAVRWCRRHGKLVLTAVGGATVALLLASQWFDHSYEELVQWGDEELATGNIDTAAEVYARAWRKGTVAQQRTLIDRVVQTCRLSEDPAQAVNLALHVLTIEPTLSFGDLDPLIAQTLVARERSSSPSGAIDIHHPRPRDSLELVRQRLELALQRPVPPARQRELQEALTAVQSVLSTGTSAVHAAPRDLHQLPSGTPEELQRIGDDSSQPAWNRGKAVLALGRQREDAGDSTGALKAYRQALDLLRPAYPYTGGVRAQLGAGHGNDAAADADECRLVAQLLADLQRLAPDEFAQPTGGLSFGLSGVPLPSDAILALRIELRDPAVTALDQGLPHQLPRLVLVEHERKSFVGVLPGRYRLEVRGHQARWGSDNARLMRLLQVDTEDWPNEVNITTETLELPPAQLRLAKEIRLTFPSNGAAVNLDEALFRWREVPGAAYYQVRFEYTTEAPHPSSTTFAVIRTESPELSLNRLDAADRKSISENLLVGRTGGWSVEAFTSTGRRMGVSLDTPRFVVARPLPQP